MKISKDYLSKRRDPHLHSPAHVLADELSSKLGDPKHFGFYLKMALTVDHNVLRKIAGDVLEKSSSNPGALFAYLIKKYNREKNTSEGYSLWLIPEPEIRASLQKLNDSLAALYKSPTFVPHITLLGNFPEVKNEQLNSLASIKEMTVELSPLEIEDTYFRSFHLPVSKNKELSAARRLAKKNFYPELKETYTPHLSILYGNFKPEEKPEMIRRITTVFPKQIRLTEVRLMKTQGLVNEWQLINSIKLQAIA